MIFCHLTIFSLLSISGNQACKEIRNDCGHPCNAPCHGETPCPSSNPCMEKVKLNCECGNLTSLLICSANSTGSMHSGLLAAQIRDLNNGNSSSISLNINGNYFMLLIMSFSVFLVLKASFTLYFLFDTLSRNVCKKLVKKLNDKPEMIVNLSKVVLIRMNLSEVWMIDIFE